MFDPKGTEGQLVSSSFVSDEVWWILKRVRHEVGNGVIDISFFFGKGALGRRRCRCKCRFRREDIIKVYLAEVEGGTVNHLNQLTGFPLLSLPFHSDFWIILKTFYDRFLSKSSSKQENVWSTKRYKETHHVVMFLLQTFEQEEPGLCSGQCMLNFCSKWCS